MNHPKAYVICATPRSGTTLLCDLLAQTGVAGRPDSFFRQQSLDWWAQRWGVSTEGWSSQHAFDQAYLDAAIHEGKGETDVFGMRLMWVQVANLLKQLNTFFPNLPGSLTRIEAAFGSTCFIHLSRQDKIAQAISRIKAEQSGLWHLHADGRERERVKPHQPPIYDADQLAQQVAIYEETDAAWVNWFAEWGIRPIQLTYESLSASPQTTVATILSALGLDPQIAETIAPKTQKLADQESKLWAARFRNT